VVISQQNINDMFNDLDEDNADLLAASLNYNPERLASARIGPTYYSVSQQLVCLWGSPRPKASLISKERWR
jgi:membrane-bound lytic murein transglycosylase F